MSRRTKDRAKRTDDVEHRCFLCDAPFSDEHKCVAWPYEGSKWHDGRYVVVRAPRHPNADVQGKLYEHTLVASRAMGKPIPEGAVVHHVNGVRTDNRPSNLVVCQDTAYHFLLHRRAAALAECGNPDWRACRYCGEHGDPGGMYVSPSGEYANHRSCHAQYQNGLYHKSREGQPDRRRREHREPMRSVDHPQAKLTLGDAREIRRLRSSGGWTLKGLADRYGVSRPTVSRVVKGETYTEDHPQTCPEWPKEARDG